MAEKLAPPVDSSPGPRLDTPLPPDIDMSLKGTHDSTCETASPWRGELDGVYVVGISQEELDFYAAVTPQMKAALNRKVDMRLIPMLGALYFISHLDRGTIGNARIEGMAADLRMSGAEYNVALAIFFASYMALEVPSNAVLKRLSKPRFFLGGCTLGFGVIMCMHGVVRNGAGLVACRFLLGAFESGFFPGALYLCSAWYMPSDVAVRMGGMYSLGAVSGAFSGLFAAAVAKMGGVGGYEGWRWIFLVLGFLTLVLGAGTLFLLIDLPSPSTRWLSATELRILELQRRIKQGGLGTGGADVEGGATGFRWRELRIVCLNWRNWVLSLVLMFQGTGFYGAKFHLPTLTKSMGFSNTNAQLLSAPPYLLGGIASILVPYLSDRCQRRGYFILGGFGTMTAGWAVVAGLRGRFGGGGRLAAGYVATSVAVAGCYVCCPLITAWGTNNVAPAGRRAMLSALIITVGNLGGVAGSFVFLDAERPVYTTGNAVMVAAGGLGFGLAVVLTRSWARANAENRARDEREVRAMYSDDELLLMGDTSPFFRYTI